MKDNLSISEKGPNMRMKYLVVTMFTILVGCGSSSPPENNSCGLGTEVSLEKAAYCVFKAEITETGFSCPADYPNPNALDGGTLCSAGDISAEDLDKIQKKVDVKWKDPVVCEDLNEAECNDQTECKSLVGAPLEEEAICFGDDVFLECTNNAGGGDGSFSFGRNPENNTCWIFRDNDRPKGWQSCGPEEDGHLGRECPGGPISVGQNPSFLGCDEVSKTTDYCAAETLDWEYDAGSKVLTLTDRRVVLNCCGEREMGAYLFDGIYELVIVDKPEGEDRCSCTCVFDFGIEIPNIEPGLFEFKIYQNITDSGTRDFNSGLADSINIGSVDGSGSVELVVNDVPLACSPE